MILEMEDARFEIGKNNKISRFICISMFLYDNDKKIFIAALHNDLVSHGRCHKVVTSLLMS